MVVWSQTSLFNKGNVWLGRLKSRSRGSWWFGLIRMNRFGATDSREMTQFLAVVTRHTICRALCATCWMWLSSASRTKALWCKWLLRLEGCNRVMKMTKSLLNGGSLFLGCLLCLTHVDCFVKCKIFFL